MVSRAFLRLFKDNNKYCNFEKIPYIDSLAYTVQEFLYSNKIEDKYFNYRLDERIRLFDFMTLTAYFIGSSQNEFGRSTIKGYIADLKVKRGVNCEDTIVYKDGNLLLTNASYEMILDLLWATYIYARFYYESNQSRFWKKIMDMLFDLMVEESSLNKEEFAASNFIKSTKDAMLTMLMHIEVTEKRKKPSETKNESKTDSKEDVNTLKTRIAELEEQVEIFHQKEKGLASGINQAQVALFGLSLANTFHFNYTNKKEELAPMLHKLFGFGEAKIANYLSTPCSNEERDELANLFKDLCPPLYATIMERGGSRPKATPEVTPT